MPTRNRCIPALTTQRRIVRDSPNELGWSELKFVEGEPHSERVTGQVLVCFWHLSDLHLCDAESPSRLEYLDRFSDPDSEVRDVVGDIGTYRPQEILTVQVAVNMIKTVNALDTGPMSGAPIDAVLVTGDITDNAQRNELSWYSTLISGGVINPSSGGESSSWHGVSDVKNWDERYWHPDGSPSLVELDRPTRIYGYPQFPGLIEKAREGVVSPGLNYPILTVHGNHDALLQGTVSPSPELRTLSMGGEIITGLPVGQTPMALLPSVAPHGPAYYIHDSTSPRKLTTSDSMRDFIEVGEFAENIGETRNFWTRTVRDVYFICLDTVNPHGGWQGSIDSAQFEWLKSELNTHVDEYIVITSHHPSPTITNDFTTAPSEVRILGEEILDLVMEYPNVIAWVAGHIHFNAAILHERGESRLLEITTSSLIDWPQQGRIFEIVRSNGKIGIVSTVVDHDSPLAPHSSLTVELNFESLASISRLLAANDYRRRDQSPLNEMREGAPEVRNTVWWVSDPFA